MTQDYTAPDGNSYSRHGILARVRVEDYETGTVRPHERTHPGPLLDRLELTRATLHNLSPIFSLSTEDAWPLVEPALGGEPWGVATRRRRHRQPRLAGHRPGDPRRRQRAPRRRPAADRRRPPSLRDRARLPRRGRRRGPAQLHADVADRARRSRPHRLPHPPPALRLRRRPGADARPSAAACASSSTARRSGPTRSTRPARAASASSASTTPSTSRPTGCGSRTSTRSTAPWRGSPRPTAGSTRRSSRPWSSKAWPG